MSVSGKKPLTGASNVELTSYPRISNTVARVLTAMMTTVSTETTVLLYCIQNDPYHDIIPYVGFRENE
jgi:hypothetical protein